MAAEAKGAVTLALRFPRVEGRQGLGAGVFNPNPPPADRRRLMLAEVQSRLQEQHIAHAHTLALQGVWLGWSQTTIPFDLSWRNLIYGPGPHVIKFVLNATVNCVRTPDMLKLWYKRPSAECQMCGVECCTLHHILVGCKVALDEKRYTWRHDSVLKVLFRVVREQVAAWNAKPEIKEQVPELYSSFVAAGSSSVKKVRQGRNPAGLAGAKDWKVMVDLEMTGERMVFPPEIYSTPQRPDLVLWSQEKRRVMLIELTCPAEEAIHEAQIRKVARYAELCAECERVGWAVTMATVEVGARGYVAHSTRRCLKALGLTNREVTVTSRSLASVVARCSYAIYLACSSRGWKIPALLEPYEGRKDRLAE